MWGGVTYLLPEEVWYPSEEFEEVTGFHGISKTYAMPDGFTEETIQDDVVDFSAKRRLNSYISDTPLTDDDVFRRERMARGEAPRQEAIECYLPYVRVLKELNPELKAISFPDDDLPSMYHFIMGVVSRYHPDDIQYYLECHKLKERPSRHEDLEAVFTYLSEIGLDMEQFRPVCKNYSPRTIERITNQIRARKMDLTPEPEF